ncbi:MAG: putative lipid II flippase FtsW [Nitrospiraceae bacterium]|nr:MAG: putative lipid II flippase FtsW [Nitrospiraceae bacterium]
MNNTKDIRGILIPVILLLCTGILMVYSSTVLMSMNKYGNGFHYLMNHLFTIFIGACVMVLLSHMNYQKLRGLVYVFLAVGLIMLLLVFVPGIGISANGARRWLRLWPTTFQPSEFVKITMVFFLAHYMDRNINRMRDFKYGILVPMGIMLGFQAIVILQPDFGAVMSLGILTMGLLIMGGVKLRYIGAMFLLALPAIYVLITSSSYRMKRIMCFTDPWKDSLGCGFQLVQSFIAFGNGGILGLGPGGSKQKLYFLPEGHTDFIFSLIGEELGFIGAVIVIIFFLWFFIKGVKVANRTGDPFSYFLATGLTMMIGVQVVINLAVTTGLMPTKGLPLPFISYGGSALLINMAAVGMLMNIAKNSENTMTEQRSAADHFARYNSHGRRRR